MENLYKPIIEEAGKIDDKKASNEVLDWLIANVENFIDNHVKMFKLDLVIDSSSMPEMKKIYDCYQNISKQEDKTTGNDEATMSRMELDKIVKKIYDNFKSESEKMEKLFKRMIYYYELVGISKGNLIYKTYNGEVNITNFEYEPFSVEVTVRGGNDVVDENGDMVPNAEKEIIKKYEVPEGFVLWLEIDFYPTRPVQSVL